MSKIIGFTFFAILASQIGSVANAAVIDFSTVDSFHDSNAIERIGDVTFSYKVIPNANPDGFWQRNGYAFNAYGESGEFFTFDNAVTLNSLDLTIDPDCCGSFLSSLTITLLDSSSNTLSSVIADVQDWVTFSFNVAGVKSVILDGFTDPGIIRDGRPIGHFGLDNIVYNTSPIPLPAAFWLFGSALVGFIGISRRRRVG